MISRLRWVWWRLTGYRELSRLLHHHSGGYDALTPTGLERMNQLARREAQLYKRGYD